MWGDGSWIIDSVPPWPRCKVLTNRDNDAPCGNATSGRTALDLPICDACFAAMQMLPSNILDPRRLIADQLGLTGEQGAA